MASDKTILYLAPTFLSYRLHKQIRGVEVFDLAFAPDLARLGHRVVVPADGSWRERLTQRFAGAAPGLEVVYTPPLRKPLWNSLSLPWLLRGRRFDATFLGNPARGLFPALGWLRQGGRMGRIVLQANRPPRPELAEKLLAWDVCCTAVSAHVAGHFPAALRERVSVYYGITGSEAFFPRARGDGSGPVRFCVVGKLDNEWKGADRAIEAFASLPADVRARARLHLASFEKRVPRGVDTPGVVMEPWRPAADVPAFLRSMDAMLVPSFGSEETFSQAAVQGMLSGLPLITSDLPVLTEKVRGEGGDCGFVCASADDYTRAMTTLVNDAALRRRMGAQARQTALVRYIWHTEEFVGRYLLPPEAGPTRPTEGQLISTRTRPA